MEIDAQSGALTPFSLESLLSQIPELADVEANISTHSFDTPIDSANASADFWISIGEVVLNNKEHFDAFIVLHGTDTMAFSATACSFMLQGLQKPIIFTGSQLPISTPNADAKRNFLGALQLLIDTNGDMAHFKEVGIYFNQKLFRATRATKIHTSSFEAFGSPNSPLLVDNEKINSELFLNGHNGFNYNSTFLKEGISVITWHPLIGEAEFKALLNEETKVLIIQSYGSGTLPLNSRSWLTKLLQKISENGGVIINKTQCFRGGVDQGMYETSNKLNEIGVISSKDMTLESVIVKAAWLYPQKPNVLEFKQAFLKDYCGEMD